MGDCCWEHRHLLNEDGGGVDVSIKREGNRHFASVHSESDDACHTFVLPVRANLVHRRTLHATFSWLQEDVQKVRVPRVTNFPFGFLAFGSSPMTLL
jgi:hypothetical protein